MLQLITTVTCDVREAGCNYNLNTHMKDILICTKVFAVTATLL
jgi:hypothetical protein